MYIVTQMLRTLALASSDVTDLVSTRISTGLASQPLAYPHIVMDVISRAESPTQDSGSAVDDYRVQVDFYAKNSTTKSALKTVSEMSEAFRDAVSRQRDATTWLADGYILESVQEVNHASDFDPEQQVARIINDFIVKIKRT